MAVDVDRVVVAPASQLERAGSDLGAESAAAGALSPAKPLNYAIWAAIIVLIALFNELAIERLRSGAGLAAGRENGPLENAQLLVMLPALALFGVSWWRGLGAVRVAGAFLGMIGALAMMREISFKSLIGNFAWLDWLVLHHLQDAFLAALGLAAAFYMFRQRQYFWDLVRLGTRWQAWPCVLSVTLLATAELYLDGFDGPTGHFWEELVETNGYFLFAVAAWKHSGLIGDRELDRPR